jgi:hypothetical protein
MAITIVGGSPTVTPLSGTAATFASTRTITAGSAGLFLLYLARAYDLNARTLSASGAGGAFTQLYNGYLAGTSGFEIVCWVGWHATPSSGAQTVTLSAGGTDLLRNGVIALYELNGFDTSSPLGAINYQRKAASSSTTATLSINPDTTGGLAIAMFGIDLATTVSSFTPSTWTNAGTGVTAAGTFPYTVRHKLGALPSPNPVTAVFAAANPKIGGVLLEIKDAVTIHNKTATISTGAEVAAVPSGASGGASKASTTVIGPIGGIPNFSWSFWMEADDVGISRNIMRVGDATTASFIMQRLATTSYGADNVLGLDYTLTDGSVQERSAPGTLSTTAQHVVVTQTAGGGARIYLDGEFSSSFRRGATLTGNLALAGTLEIGAHSATAPAPYSGKLTRFIAASEAWPQALVLAYHRNQSNPRSFYGIGAMDAADEANRSPVAMPVRVSAFGQPSVTINPLVVDPDGNTPTIVDTTLPPGGSGTGTFTAPSHGTVTFATTQMIYRPEVGYTGVDTFSYTVTDAGGKTSTSIVIVDVANAVLKLVNDSVTVPTNASAFTFNPLANDTGAAPLSLLTVSQPAHGSVTITDENQISYTPAAGYSGPDSIVYTATDGVQTGSATISITVESTAFVTCQPDTFTVVRGTAKELDVLANDTSSGTLTIISLTNPAHGTVTTSSSATKVTYTPASGYVGADSFSYTARINGGTLTGTATVNITVTAVAPLPAQWWKRFYKTASDGKKYSPLFGRQFSHGMMSHNPGADYAAFASFFGTKADAVGGNVAGTQTGNATTHRSNSWDKVIGGAMTYVGAAGTTNTDPNKAVDTVTQLNLAASQLSEWLNSYPSNTWGVLNCTMAPFGASVGGLTVWREIADGKHSDKHKRMGARLRWYIETKSPATAKKSLDNIVMRVNWEYNQNTGLDPNFYRTCRAADMTLDQATDLYNAMMAQWANDFWIGAEYQVPIALSPAQTSDYPGSTDFTPDQWLDKWLAAGIYKTVCCSWHPRSGRADTKQTAAQCTLGLQCDANGVPLSPAKPVTGNLFTPGAAIRAAKRHAIVASFLEAGPMCDGTAADPDANMGTGDWYAFATQLFFELLNDPANADHVSFVNMYRADNEKPDWLVGKAGFTAAQATNWRNHVAAHLAGAKPIART